MANVITLSSYLNNSREISICTGASRHTKEWLNTKIQWSTFVNKLRNPLRSTETLEEYEKLSKDRQGVLKDVGGYVGGEFKGNHRTAQELKSRDILSIDLDNIPANETDTIIKKVRSGGCAAVIHSTRSHRPDKPRLRIIILLNRSITPEEYEPVTRIVANKLGIIKHCDITTFQAARLMYFPSCSSDSQYIFEVIDAPLLCATSLLNDFGDWRSQAALPALADEKIHYINQAKRQASPSTKEGIVGAFCRTYDIDTAILTHLQHVYTEAGEDRYTYIQGSTSGGAIVYGDREFLFSHHATDPCCGRLVNAFDLVRLHLFSDLDSKTEIDTPEHKTLSYAAMIQKAQTDEKVCALLHSERIERVKNVFSTSENDDEWAKRLNYKKDGGLKSTVDNILTILAHDISLKDKIALDEFTAKLVVKGNLPWKQSDEIRTWEDLDDAGLYHFLETAYQIANQSNMSRAITLTASRNRYNSVEEYLTKLEWDKTPRVATLLIDYFGAENNSYTKDIMLIALPNAVARAIKGGTKYDQVPILIGAQGVGKSTFLAKLGREWFNDSLQTFEGKEAYELIQGSWIVELPELVAFGRTETNKIKQFLSKTKDNFRAAYAKNVQESPRRCVFFGTTNNTEFLRDPTGERRFWTVELGINKPIKSVFKDLTTDEVNQIWAEAYEIYKTGKYANDMRGESARIARESQKAHKEIDPWHEEVTTYLEEPKPENWESMSLEMKRMFIRGSVKIEAPLNYFVNRARACDIFTICFNKPVSDMSNKESRRINDIVRQLPNWESRKLKDKIEGVVRGFVRIGGQSEEKDSKLCQPDNPLVAHVSA